MAYDFAGYPEIGLGLPFENLSLTKWSGGLPAEWELMVDPADGTREKYSPGYAITPALKISEVGTGDYHNGIVQTISPPACVSDLQHFRTGACFISTLGGSYGVAKAVMVVDNDTSARRLLVSSTGAANWEIEQENSVTPITTAADIKIALWVDSYLSSVDPAGVFDRVFIEYGRTVDERYYTFTRYPEHAGLRAPIKTFTESGRVPGGELTSFDPSGGNAKMEIVMPFRGIPASMVEVLREFWNLNKGLGAYDPIPLVLHHKLVDTTATHTAGENFLNMPPWIICDIKNPEAPFDFAGSFAGADLFDGTLTFIER